MTFALAQALLLADAVTADDLGQALLLSATRGASLVRSLQATGAIDPMRLEQHLERGEAPAMRHVAPVMSLVERLPSGLCERLLILPVRQDPRTGTVDVAVVDARDGHAAEEVAFWLKAPVRVVRTSLASMDAAFRRLEAKPAPLGMQALAPPIGAPATPEEPDAAPGTRRGTGPNIPIPLTRRSLAAIEVPPLGAPVEERDPSREPVLDLQRRKVPPPPSQPAAPSASAAPPEDEAPPITERGPFPPRPQPAARAAAPVEVPLEADLPATLEALAKASDRDRIVDLLVAGVRTVARRVAVLAVRRDAIVGWACSPEVADPATFRKVRISTATPTVLTEALEQGGAWLARFPRDLAHAPLLEMLKQSPSDNVAIAGARVEGRPALAIVAGELTDASRAKKDIAELAQAGGEALARLLRERRK